MARLDRADVVELLGRLGAESEEAVVKAARELHRKVSEAGIAWTDLLRADWEGAAAAANSAGDTERAPGDEPPQAETPDDDEAGVSDADKAGVSDADKTEATRLIGRLLARKDLSDNLRDELTEMKRSIVEGSFDAMDRRYVRALAKRLGA